MRITRHYMNGLEYKDQLALLKKDGMLLPLIDRQTGELCRAAVKQNGNALCWVQDMKLNILLEVIRSWEAISPGYINSYKKNKTDAKTELFDSALVECCRSRIKGWIDDNSYRKKISAYSGLSGKKLQSLHDRLSKKYAKLFNDKTVGIRERLKRIDAAIAAKKSTKSKVLLKDLIREWFYRQLRALSILGYISMDKRGDYGDLGKDNLYMGMIRNIMDIPNDDFVEIDYQFFFDMILDHYDSANGLKSGEEYMALTKDLTLELFGEILNDESEINEVILFLETDGLRNITGNRNGLKFLFGRMEEKIVDGTTVKIYLDEYARAQHTLSNVGWAGKDFITIRREALSVVFFNKWRTFFLTPPFKIQFKPDEINSAISAGLKRKALEFYHVHNTTDVIVESDIISREIEDGVIAHEIAHQRVDALLNPIYEHIRDAFCGDGDNVIYTLREAEADWTGAISWFLSIAREEGPEAMARVIWVFFSDNFFLTDDEDEYFTLMAKVLIGLLLPFVKNDGLIDFSALAMRQELICRQLNRRMEKIIRRILNLIEASNYRILNLSFNYQQLEEEFFILFMENKIDYTREQLKNDYDYWHAVVNVFKFFSPQNEEMKKLLAEEALSLEAFVLEAAGAGPGITLLNYIYGRFADMGIYT